MGHNRAIWAALAAPSFRGRWPVLEEVFNLPEAWSRAGIALERDRPVPQVSRHRLFGESPGIGERDDGPVVKAAGADSSVVLVSWGSTPRRLAALELHTETVLGVWSPPRSPRDRR